MLQNLRWLIDGQPATQFVMGRCAEMAVDVASFSGGDLVFELKTADGQVLASHVVPTAATAAASTVRVPERLNPLWKGFEFTEKFSYFNESCKALANHAPAPAYPVDNALFQPTVNDDLLYPPLVFTVTAPGQAAVTSPTIRRAAPQYRDGNAVSVLVNGNQVLPSLRAAIQAAQQHVHLDWFFFSPDVIGNKVVDDLKACAARGVEVRVLFDHEATAVPESVGGQGAGPIAVHRAIKALTEVGAKVADSGLLFPPLDRLQTITDPEYRDRLEAMKAHVLQQAYRNGLPLVASMVSSGMASRSILGKAGNLYRELRGLGAAGVGTPLLMGGARDHCKLVIIDGRIGFCGGLNCAKIYLFEQPFDPTKDVSDEEKDPSLIEQWGKWHDVFARVEGPAVQDMQRFFIERWAVNSGEYLSRTDPRYFPGLQSVGPARVKFLANVPGLERDCAGGYLGLFRNAQQKLLVENPYLTDDLMAVYLARAAQVQHLPVDLIVPDKHLDFGIARDLMRARWDALRAAGIHLYAYQKHMSHVKVATADGRYSIVGSYNFAKSSALQLFECSIMVDDAGFAQQVEDKIFNFDRPLCDAVTTGAGTDWSSDCSGIKGLADRFI